MIVFVFFNTIDSYVVGRYFSFDVNHCCVVSHIIIFSSVVIFKSQVVSSHVWLVFCINDSYCDAIARYSQPCVGGWELSCGTLRYRDHHVVEVVLWWLAVLCGCRVVVTLLPINYLPSTPFVVSGVGTIVWDSEIQGSPCCGSCVVVACCIVWMSCSGHLASNKLSPLYAICCVGSGNYRAGL